MLQSLEWEPSGSFYQKPPLEPNQTSRLNDYSGASGLTDMNLSIELTDPTLPPNPRKAILYRPTATHFLAVSIHYGFLNFVFSKEGHAVGLGSLDSSNDLVN